MDSEHKNWIAATIIAAYSCIIHYFTTDVGIKSALCTFFWCGLGFAVGYILKWCVNRLNLTCSICHNDEEEADIPIRAGSLPDAPVLDVGPVEEGARRVLNRPLMPGYVRERRWRNDDGAFAESVVITRPPEN